MRSRAPFGLIALAVALSSQAASAQSLSIWPHVIASGGGVSSGGGLTLSGTIGQTAAGPADGPMIGGAFEVRSGFWASGRPNCPSDFNNDGTVDTRDVLAFLSAWNTGDGAADCDRSGTVDTRDVLCYLNLWSAGC